MTNEQKEKYKFLNEAKARITQLLDKLPKSCTERFNKIYGGVNSVKFTDLEHIFFLLDNTLENQNKKEADNG